LGVFGGGALGPSVCALTMRARRPSAGRDWAPKWPAEPRGRTAAPAKELMVIMFAINQPRKVNEGEKEATDAAAREESAR